MLHSEIVQGCKDHYGEGDKVCSKLPLFSSCKVEVTQDEKSKTVELIDIPWAPSADLLMEEVEKFLAQFARGLDNAILKVFLFLTATADLYQIEIRQAQKIHFV